MKSGQYAFGGRSEPARTLRIFIGTGEASGDLQGAMLIQALYRQASAAGLLLEIVALGGSRMAAAGATLLADTSAIGSVGLVEAIPYILPTLRIQQQAKRYLRQQPPDVAILIDYQGPNLQLGNYLRSRLPQIPVVYYIAPQVWIELKLWGIPTGHKVIQQLSRFTDRFLAIFLSEANYLQRHGGNVSWIGHPIVDRVQALPNRAEARAALGIEDNQLAVALLPASRQQEIQYLLPTILRAAKQLQEKLPQVYFWVPLSLPRYRAAVQRGIDRYQLRATVLPNLEIERSSQQREYLRTCAIAAADLAITKSGTANLEIALLDVPQIVLYRLNPFTAWVSDVLLRASVPFISPVNLVQMKTIVPELLQKQVTPANIVRHAMELLLDPARRQQMRQDYQATRQALGKPGACDRAAREIFAVLQAGRSDAQNFPASSRT